MMAKKLFKRFDRFLPLVVIGIGTSGLAFGDAPPIEFFPAPVAIDGSLMRVRVAEVTDGQGQPCGFEGEFEETTFPFYSVGDKKCEAIFAVPFNSKPGKKILKIRTPGTLTFEVGVEDGNYPSETIRVSDKHVNPNKKDLARIQKESIELAAVYRKSTPQKIWKGNFGLPIDSVFTSPFGTKRVFNGQLKSFHQGVDLKAAQGVAVRAPADGIVSLAKDLFFSGGTVILDHGYGLFTIYCHLSSIQAKPGQKVSQGDPLGLTGMTGRASGPHLHWGAVVHKAKFNPRDLMKVLQ